MADAGADEKMNDAAAEAGAAPAANGVAEAGEPGAGPATTADGEAGPMEVLARVARIKSRVCVRQVWV